MGESHLGLPSEFNLSVPRQGIGKALIEGLKRLKEMNA